MKVPCACGCGRLIDPWVTLGGRRRKPSRGPRRYINGHQARLQQSPRILRECACGCKETFEVSISSIRGRKKRYVYGHHQRKGVYHPNFQTARAQENRKLQGKLTTQKRTVPAAPVQRALRAKGWTPNALAKELNISYQVARQYFKRARITRESAERLLRVAAGLPRMPNKKEIQETQEHLEAHRRQVLAKQKRQQRSA